jgi:hypothetical protein
MSRRFFWNLLTWWYGLPSSSSHALVGSLIGAAVAGAAVMSAMAPLTERTAIRIGLDAVKFAEVKDKKEKSLTPASPELLASIGDKIRVNGNAYREVCDKDVMVVVFCATRARWIPPSNPMPINRGLL